MFYFTDIYKQKIELKFFLFLTLTHLVLENNAMLRHQSFNWDQKHFFVGGSKSINQSVQFLVSLVKKLCIETPLTICSSLTHTLFLTLTRMHTLSQFEDDGVVNHQELSSILSFFGKKAMN